MRGGGEGVREGGAEITKPVKLVYTDSVRGVYLRLPNQNPITATSPGSPVDYGGK